MYAKRSFPSLSCSTDPSLSSRASTLSSFALPLELRAASANDAEQKGELM